MAITRYFATIKPEHVGIGLQRWGALEFGKHFHQVVNCMGRILPIDVGRKLYLVTSDSGYEFMKVSELRSNINRLARNYALKSPV